MLQAAPHPTDCASGCLMRTGRLIDPTMWNVCIEEKGSGNLLSKGGIYTLFILN